MLASVESQRGGRTRVELPELLAMRLSVPSGMRERHGTARSALSGAHASRMRGRGMDYAESRMYQPGDDVRQLDWRLTARSGRLHTKVFQEERERTLIILVDTHADMRFGTRRRFKSVQAARAAAFAAWCAVRAGERVGVVAFGASRDAVRPRGGQRGALGVAGALVAWDRRETDGHESLSDALVRATRLTHNAGQVLLISDGASVDEGARTHLLQLRRRADVGVLVVADPLELAPPPPGRYPVMAGDAAQYLELYGATQRNAFREAMGEGVSRLEHLARSLHLRHRLIDTVESVVQPVLELRGNLTGARP